MSEPRRSPRVAVVGAGISGLACAHRLAKLLPESAVTVYDAADRAGGKILTTPIDGILVDEAADAFLARVPAAVALCRELGLADQLVTPAERRAFVYRHGALHRFPEAMVLGVPTDLDALEASGLLSPAGIAAVRADVEQPPPTRPAVRSTTSTGGRTAPDESVGALVRRHAGDEVYEAFVSPLLSGVHAGDADELSVAAATPQFAAAVAEHGSLIRGLQAQREAASVTADPTAPIFYGLRNGSQTLIDALVGAIGAPRVRTGAAITSVTHSPARGDWSLAGVRGTAPFDDTADAIVLATPAPLTADLVDGPLPTLVDELRSVPFASVVLVTFAVPRDGIEHALDGSGFLVSDGEGLMMTACSFGSSKWAHWDPANGDVILRVSAGRFHDERALELDDDELVAQLRRELAETIGMRAAPTAVRVSHWDRALPQFRPGHLERATSWKATARERAPGLFLTGASYFGLGIPACITDAERTAHEIEHWWWRS